MMKLLKNEKLARWVIGIVVVGLVMAYVPLLFVPQQAAAPQPEQQPVPDQAGQQPTEPLIQIVSSSVGVEALVSSSATGTEK